MIRVISSFIEKVTNIGIGPDTSWIQANRIQITNSFLVFAFPLIFINIITNIFEKDYVGLILGFVWIFTALFIPYFNSRGKHYTTFVFVIIIFTLMTDVVHLVLGRSALLSPLYIVSILMVIFFFEKKKEYIAFLFFIMLNYVGVHYYLANYETKSQSTYNAIDIHLYFVFSVIAIIAITLKVLNENKKQLKETERLLKIVKNKNQELERFAYITSHDLKEPLRSIAGFSDLLQRKLAKSEDDTTKEYLNFIKKSTLQLNDLMDSVLDFVQISNMKEGEVQAVNLNEILEKEIAVFNNPTLNAVAQIRYTDLPIIQGVANHFSILFHHIIDNGIKFNEKEIPVIEINCQESPTHFNFFIRDNGIGIEKEYLKDIFLPFKKLHNKSKYEGAGIGLSVCKRIIEHYQGEISIVSKKNQGTTFSFSLPKVR